MPIPEHYQLADGRCVPLRLYSHPRARRLRLKVRAPGQVELGVPPGCSQAKALAFLRQNDAWLARQLTLLLTPISPPEQLLLPAIDEQWRLNLRPGATRNRVSRSADTLTIAYTEAGWEGPLRGWLAKRAAEHLPPWLDATSTRLDIPYSRLTIRGQRSRWGSCSAQGSISLNYKSLLLPKACVEYLLVHELCHRRHMDHSPRFWALVSHYLPDHLQRRRTLRLTERTLPRWLHG